MCCMFIVTPRGTLLIGNEIEPIVKHEAKRDGPLAVATLTTHAMTSSTSKTKVAWPDCQPRLLKNQKEDW